ncbi:hypothetical protein HHK36_027445 [Tetracentron sinense]|uniref:Aluminum-activated malate transporter 10 n=1 Tax=Tetracentron sinense TaxID=13715 RepID=A0A835D4F4_TETSI|nr:hypothetical protein HHK36_027445 [Tetracentron sinense]
MVHERDASGGLEWRVRVAHGPLEILAPEFGPFRRAWFRLQGLILGLVMKIWRFLEKAWDLGVDEPRKIIHCLKVGMALTVVSLFYYMRPLYEGVGGNAMWAVLTVVVVFEYTVGATLSKSLNRATGTFLAGTLAVGVHWVASQSGEKFEPVVLGASVFLLASTATFFRFIPMVKARFDYGALVFILTFSLVSLSGYRVDRLFKMAHERLSTIAIGTSMCILISMIFCPVWAGKELYLLITRNMGKLANSLDGCVVEYFKDSEPVIESEEESHMKLQGYKCVLNSKATEESLMGTCPYGHFNFQHPWKQYLKIGASMRHCAYCIETLNTCINSENQAPEFIKKHLRDVCITFSSYSSSVLKELAITTKTMRKSSKIDYLVGEMNSAVQDLQNALKSLPNLLISPQLPVLGATENEKRELTSTTTMIPLMEVIPLFTVATLLMEIAARIEGVVNAVDELADMAEFKPAADDKNKQNQPTNKITSDNKDQETMKALQKV